MLNYECNFFVADWIKRSLNLKKIIDFLSFCALFLAFS